jgi:DNA replication licensing factor MCM5
MASAFGWDQGAVYSTAVGGINDEQTTNETYLATQNQFYEFLQQWNIQGNFVYR